MAGMQEKYDTAFLGIMQNEGKIADFLDCVYSFLYRRTDYFLTMKSKEDKMGFPPGVSLKLTVNAFQKYEKMAKADEERRAQAAAKLRKKQEEAAMEVSVPVAVKEEVVTSMKTPPAEMQVNEAVAEKGREEDAEATTGNKVKATEDNPAQVNQRVADSGDSKPKPTAGNDDDDDVDIELARRQAIYQANPLSHNGAIRDQYSWGQSITDVDAYVKVPSHVKQGKSVKVSIQRKHLKVSYRDSSGEFIVAVDDNLPWDVNLEESMWTLIPGEHIHVNMEKVQERWWEQLVESEEKISIRKIDPSRPMTDLDDEAQAKIGEMMYNERQKKLGLPQSHEQKAHSILKEAWDAEGSPFKGQPFDPSKLNISANSASDLAKFT